MLLDCYTTNVTKTVSFMWRVVFLKLLQKKVKNFKINFKVYIHYIMVDEVFQEVYLSSQLNWYFLHSHQMLSEKMAGKYIKGVQTGVFSESFLRNE